MRDLKHTPIASTLTGARNNEPRMIIDVKTMRPTILTLFGVLIAALVLSACGGQDSPIQAVENYLKLRVASDAPKLLAASCKDWEGQASVEAASFEAMNAQLEGMTCKQTGEEGLFTIVACQGKIVTNYAGETRNWDLAARSFKVLKEDGQWKMCGYQ